MIGSIIEAGMVVRGGNPRVVGPISSGELERRWRLVRDRLRERGIDALVVVGTDADLSGYSRWLTASPVTYRKVVAIYPDDLMTVIDHGGAGRTRNTDGSDPDYPGAGDIITVSAFSSVAYTQAHEAEQLITVLRRRGVRSVALAGPGSMPHGFHQALRDGLGDIEWYDETAFLDRCKAIKSAEEIALIESAAAIQDAAFGELLAHIRPGMQDFEVSAAGHYAVRRRGGDAGIVLAGSAPKAEPAFMRSPAQGARTIAPGDTLTLLIENGSPAGYFAELGRNITIGAPSAEASELHAMLVEAQAVTHRLLRPGAQASDIHAAHNAWMTAHGLPPEARLYAHSQGLDLIERPLIRDDEDMEIAVGMCLAVHPAGVWRGTFGFVCDNVVIEADGPRRLHQTARALFRVD